MFLKLEICCVISPFYLLRVVAVFSLWFPEMSLARLKSRVFFLPEKNSINIFSLLACFKFERHIVKIARVMKVSLGHQ